MISRRNLLKASGGVALLTASGPLLGRGLRFPAADPALLGRAKAAFRRHRHLVANPGTMILVDFSRASCEERLYLIDIGSGWMTSYLVAHGRGSDPGHSGFLQRFSNEPGSEASSEGAYITGAVYAGRNGTSLRLKGLERTNSNAEARNIVIHAADYAEPEMVARCGKLGRSEGCFAVPHSTLRVLLEQAGPGCLLYCDKLV